MSALLIMISGVSSGDEIAVLLRSNPYGKAVAMHTLEVYVKTCIIFFVFWLRAYRMGLPARHRKGHNNRLKAQVFGLNQLHQIYIDPDIKTTSAPNRNCKKTRF